jgi:hypothetical protein
MDISLTVIRKIAKENGLSVNNNILAFAQGISNHVSGKIETDIKKKVARDIVEMLGTNVTTSGGTVKVKFRNDLSFDDVRALFDYDGVNGGLVWKKDGKPAGSVEHHGYIRIGVRGKTYRAHHLVWLWHHGVFPDTIVDHINQIKNDNRIENLRLSDPTLNNLNRTTGSNNTSGYKGVSYLKKRNKYEASITVKGKMHRLGQFNTFEEAKYARMAYEEELLNGG